ncbi:nucleotidyltransferase family protein [Caulobacter segnis]
MAVRFGGGQADGASERRAAGGRGLADRVPVACAARSSWRSAPTPTCARRSRPRRRGSPPPTDLTLVAVENPAEGMGASLRTAAQALPDDGAGVFVLLGDMPAIDPATLQRLGQAFKGPLDLVAPTYLGRRGHPVLFGATWFPALRALSGDEGARALLESAGAQLTRIPVEDPGIHLDVDRPEDLVRAVEDR